MTITQVRYVCEIAKSGSMTKAANRFFISQPALSEQMKALEAAISKLEKSYGKGAIMKLGEPSAAMSIEAASVISIFS